MQPNMWGQSLRHVVVVASRRMLVWSYVISSVSGVAGRECVITNTHSNGCVDIHAVCLPARVDPTRLWRRFRIGCCSRRLYPYFVVCLSAQTLCTLPSQVNSKCVTTYDMLWRVYSLNSRVRHVLCAHTLLLYNNSIWYAIDRTFVVVPGNFSLPLPTLNTRTITHTDTKHWIHQMRETTTAQFNRRKRV